MNNNNIVKIGTALKWRGDFDMSKKYYQENIVTVSGCVFRCKVLSAKGKSPVTFTDKTGHMVYDNTDTWDVIVDMAYFFNYAVDNNRLTQETLEYVKKLDAEIKRQQGEIDGIVSVNNEQWGRIEAIKADDRDQWEHINAIEVLNIEQQREIDSVLDTISCFSEGIWHDTLLWSNETVWDNNKYAITDDLQAQLTALNDRHNAEVLAIIEHIEAHETTQEEYEARTDERLAELEAKAQATEQEIEDLLSALTCIGDGVWSNDLKWNNSTHWVNSNYATESIDVINDRLSAHDVSIAELAEDIALVQQRADATHEAINQVFDDFKAEHETFRNEHEQFREEHQEIAAKQSEVDKILDKLIIFTSCIVEGYWNNERDWFNEGYWNNNDDEVSCGCPENIESRLEELEENAERLDSRLDDAKNDTLYVNGRVDEVIRDNAATLSLLEAQNERIAALESALAELLPKVAQQAEQLEVFTTAFTLSNFGQWHNPLCWDNDSTWFNLPVAERTCDCMGMANGESIVVVSDYDPETDTVALGAIQGRELKVREYSSETESVSLCDENNDDIPVQAYNGTTRTLSI